MDHTAAGRTATRPFTSRHPRLVLLTLAATGVGLAIRYNSEALKKNELAQKAGPGANNYYVSVDRSGGGI